MILSKSQLSPISLTVMCVFLFYGYGFGQFGRFGATAATLIALAIFLFQILMSALWLKYFAYGPMEWIWRQLTYRQRLDLRLKRALHEESKIQSA